jgi:hypothetical protein
MTETKYLPSRTGDTLIAVDDRTWFLRTAPVDYLAGAAHNAGALRAIQRAHGLSDRWLPEMARERRIPLRRRR